MIVERLLTPQTALENKILEQSGLTWYPINPRCSKKVGVDGSEFKLAGYYVCDDQQLTALNEKLMQAKQQQGLKNE